MGGGGGSFHQIKASSLKKLGLAGRLLGMVMRFQFDSYDAQFPHCSSYCNEVKFSD